MGWRSSHGARRDTNGPVRIEVQPADELGKPDKEDIQARVDHAQKTKNWPFKKGNTAAKGRRPKLARLGVDIRGMEAKDPRYKSFLRQAEGYRRKRVREMKMAHGYVGIGVMTLIATASLQLAMSRYMMTLAGDDMDMDLMKKASGLANDARQNELAAWELCSREAGVNAALKASATPWLARPEAKPRVKEEAEEWLAAGEEDAHNGQEEAK